MDETLEHAIEMDKARSADTLIYSPDGPYDGLPPARLGQRLTALNAQGEAVEAVVVPVKATQAMQDAFELKYYGLNRPGSVVYESPCADAYEAMIAAANG